MTQQEGRQVSVRAVTSTALDYNGDWMALFDIEGIPPGPFNGRMLAWISQGGVAPEVYPASVVASDALQGGATMRAVWDLYTTSGSRVSSLTPFASLSLAGLPGVTRTANGVGPACGIAGGVESDINAVDFSGYSIWVSADNTLAKLIDCSIPGASTLRVFNGFNTAGAQVGSPTLDLEFCTLNLAGGESADHAMIQNKSLTCPMIFNGCRIYNSPRTGSVLIGSATITNTLLGAFGTTFNAGDHTEMLQLSDGTFVLRRCLLDPKYLLAVVSGITGDIQLQALNGVATTLLIDQCIFVNSAGLLDYPLSFKADFANVTVTIQNSIIQKGANGYISPFNAPGLVLTVNDGGHNIDFDDSHTLNLALVQGP